jgi:hypothetical protein
LKSIFDIGLDQPLLIAVGHTFTKVWLVTPDEKPYIHDLLQDVTADCHVYGSAVGATLPTVQNTGQMDLDAFLNNLSFSRCHKKSRPINALLSKDSPQSLSTM